MNSAWLCRNRVLAAVRPSTVTTACYYRLTELTLAARRAYSQTIATHGPAPRVAIIGSGPAGFYTARKLMREVHGTKVDMYERLPVPFGLVRFGVAPDHPEVKNCQDEFEQVAASPDFNFIGNVQLGQDLPLPILSKHYDAIVFSYGASKDRTLGLKGEAKPHIYSARAFVGWYNGLPEYRDLDPDLSAGDTAIVVGQGNVAMDVTRILLSKTEALQKTDLTQYAIDALKGSRIKHVHVVGRRGPMQAAFTIKEVRELLQLDGVNFKQIPHNLFPADLKKLERPKRRLMELLKKGKPHSNTAERSWALHFLLAPESLSWSEIDPDTLTGLTFTKNTIADLADPASKVSPTDEKITLPASTLFRSIGYRAEAIPGMDQIGAPFDERSGTLCHDGFGRIVPLDTPDHQEATRSKASLYCAGWVKRGPTGVIASTMTDAFQTAEAIVEDWKRMLASSKRLSLQEAKKGWQGVKEDAASQGYALEKVVTWDGWHRIDQAEKMAGEAVGKPREKLGSVREMLTVVNSV